MKNFAVYAVLVVCFVACGSNEKKIPEDVLPINKMKLVVWDLIQSGEYAKSLIESDTSIKNINTAYLAGTLKLHDINKNDFFKSFNYYQAHPLLNKELFDSVSAYAQRQRNDIYKKRR